MAADLSASDEYIVKETATLNWTINDFNNLTSQVKSQQFSLPFSRKTFRLHLNPKTVFAIEDEVCISLFYFQYQNDLAMRYRVSIVNSNGEKQYTQEYYWIYNAKSNLYQKTRDFKNYIRSSSCAGYLTNGNLIINCEVDILEKSLTNVFNKTNVTAENDQINLQNDLEGLLENPKFSDASLIVKNKEFKVHKVILASRSNVFEAMFSNDLEEKKQNKVEIPDVEVEVFEHLLRYIYTGKVPNMDEYALELFVAADKYQLEHLKSICEQALGSHLNIESVVNVLVIADMHTASELKLKCIEYINANSIAVKKTEQWEQMKTRPVLLMELYDNISVKLDSMSIKA